MADIKVKKCNSCLYRIHVDGEWACYYCVIKGTMRPCKASKCTVYKPYSDKARYKLKEHSTDKMMIFRRNENEIDGFIE